LNCVGSGILFFPKVMSDVGIVAAPLLCILCAVVCTECGTLIHKACAMLEEHTGEVITSYEEFAHHVGGPRMEKLVMVTKNFAMLGFIIVYFGLVSDSVYKFIPNKDQISLGMVRFFIVFPVFALLAMLQNLQQLARFAILGIIAMGFECVLLVAASFAIGGGVDVCPGDTRPPHSENGACNWYSLEPADGWLGPMGKAMSIFLFSYAILATIPSVRSQLKNPSELPQILRVSFGFCSILNIFIMSAGYYAFGGGVADNQNDGLELYYAWIAQFVAVAIIINLLLSTPLYSYCIISVFEASGTDALRTPLSIPNIAFRVGLILALATTNHFLPYAMEVIGLVSSVFATANNILFPLGFFYLARKVVSEEAAADTAELADKSGLEIGSEPKSRSRVVAEVESGSALQYGFHALVLLVGLCVLVFGVQGSLQTLMKKIAEDSAGATSNPSKFAF